MNKFLRPKKEFTTVRFDESIVGFAGGSLKITIDTTFSLIVMEEAFLRVMGACEYTLNSRRKFRRLRA